MKALFVSMTFAAGLLLATGSYAQAPAGAPAGSTGLCKDGTYYSGASKRGACSRHGGVKDWYGAPADAPAATTSATPTTTPTTSKPATTTAPAPATTPAPAPTAATTTPAAKTTTTSSLPATPAAGGGPGKVWVNTSTKVYHCPNDKYYGKTKKGEYLTEAEAKAQGARAARGKDCD